MKQISMLSIFMIFSFFGNFLNAQITYTQTSDEDFLKGNHNNVWVSGGKVYLEAMADQPSTWLSTTVLPEPLTKHQIIT